MAGRGYVDTWKPWSDKARTADKLDILHQQSEELRRRIDNLRTRLTVTSAESRRKYARLSAVLQPRSDR
jgi:hypothetical protein